MLLAHSPFYHWCLRPFVPTVLDRSRSRLGRAQRVHFHELGTYKGTLHPQAHEQTRDDGFTLHRADWRVPDRTVYLRTWTPALVEAVGFRLSWSLYEQK